MRPLLRTVLLGGALLAAAFAALSFVATEGGEVVVLETRGPDGPRLTRVWVADHEGRPWIEVANPEREFWADIQRDPNVQLERGGERRPYLAVAFPSPEGHARIRALLRAKYGWADRWLQRLVDTSQSIALRLDPLPPRSH